MDALDHWRDAENARLYDRFARSYPMYRLTSADLVQRAALRPDSRVLDLARERVRDATSGPPPPAKTASRPCTS